MSDTKATSKAALQRSAAKLARLLAQSFEAKRTEVTASISNVSRDTAGRTTAAIGTIGAVSGQRILISHGQSVAQGDVWRVVNEGTPAAPRWVAVQKLRSSPYLVEIDPNVVLPTPTGLQVLSGLYRLVAGSSWRAFLRCSWLGIGAQYGQMGYEVEYCTNTLEDITTILVTDRQPTTLLDGAVDASQTALPRNPDAPGYEDDFPSFGRLQIGAEKIDYLAVTTGQGDSGTGTGAANALTDATKSWTVDRWSNYLVTDSTGASFVIVANTATVLTVSGTPASGAYTIRPCFSGCTRGAGGTTPAPHADNSGVGCLSVGVSVTELLPQTNYQVRVRARSTSGALSPWSAWVSVQTELDQIPPPAPAGFAVADAVGGVDCTWTGPTAGTCLDLAGFRLYAATDQNGTGAVLVAETAPTLRTFYPMSPPGVGAYFNLTAFDRAGNESEYAVSAWPYGRATMGTGEQILYNADWERDLDGDGVPDTWTFAGGELYGSYGQEGGKGIRLVIPNGGWRLVSWDPRDNDIKVRASVGHSYCASVFFKTALPDDDIWYGNGAPDGHLTIHPWVTYATVAGAQGISSSEAWWVYDLESDWRRCATRDLAGDWVGEDAWYLGYYAYLVNKTGAEVTVDLDRPQLEWGDQPSEWKPGLVPGTGSGRQGLLIDAAGIITSDGVFALGRDGRLYSDLLPDADDTRDLGSDARRWQEVHAVNVYADNLVVQGTAVDHGGLAGLGDDDHSQYLNATRHAAVDHDALVDHGSIGGLGDDDHAQYLNTGRHDTTTRHALGTVVPHDDHGALAGLGDDDHGQYVHLSTARTITAQHTFAPEAEQAPFALGVNARGQVVEGLMADRLNVVYDDEEPASPGEGMLWLVAPA